jgi:hypothetical protein
MASISLFCLIETLISQTADVNEELLLLVV